MGCGGSTQPQPAQPPKLQGEWDAAGVKTVQVVVRAVSGNELCSLEGATPSTPVSTLLQDICRQTQNDSKIIQLCCGNTILRPGFQVGDCITPPSGGTLELTLLRLPGPHLEASARSGKQIGIAEPFPVVGSRCHFDRDYTFLSLGDFTKIPGMLYIQTCNDDKSTPSNEVMWRLDLRVPATVYLNFRSDRHVTETGARNWLSRDGWELRKFRSTSSSGPQGPYQGPVYSQRFDPTEVKLMGSNFNEGTYFVFVDTGVVVAASVGNE